jgi:hypothetical protein
VIRGCPPKPVQPSAEALGLDCPQVLSVVQSPPTNLVVLDQHGVQLEGEGNQHVEDSAL